MAGDLITFLIHSEARPTSDQSVSIQWNEWKRKKPLLHPILTRFISLNHEKHVPLLHVNRIKAPVQEIISFISPEEEDVDGQVENKNGN